MQPETVAGREPHWLQIALVGRHPKRTLLRAGVLAIALVACARFLVLPIRVEGPSMWPTYREGRFNLVNRLAFVFHPPQRGDVVSIRTTGISIMYMKRIIALPGETIAFQGGNAFVNGQMLVEPYVNGPCDWEIPPRTLGPDEYYVVGDNRSMPQESRTKGVARREKIVGKVLL